MHDKIDGLRDMIDFALCSHPVKQQSTVKCERESLSRPITAAAGSLHTSSDSAEGLTLTTPEVREVSNMPNNFSATVWHEDSSDKKSPIGRRCIKEQKTDVSIPSMMILRAAGSGCKAASMKEL